MDNPEINQLGNREKIENQEKIELNLKDYL